MCVRVCVCAFVGVCDEARELASCAAVNRTKYIYLPISFVKVRVCVCACVCVLVLKRGRSESEISNFEVL